MTDTGQIPGEGLLPGEVLPENGVGAPALQPHTDFPGNGVPQQSGWGTDPLTETPPGFAAGTPNGFAGVTANPTYTFLEQPPAPGAGLDDEEDVLLMPGPQGSWSDPQPVPPQPPITVPAAGPGPVYAGVPGPGVGDAAAGQAPVAPAPRRPLHMGPPIPDPPTGGVSVRSLADRGPAVRASGPAASGPEYLDAPSDDTAATPAQQTTGPSGPAAPAPGSAWPAVSASSGAQQSLIPHTDSFVPAQGGFAQAPVETGPTPAEAVAAQVEEGGQALVEAGASGGAEAVVADPAEVATAGEVLADSAEVGAPASAGGVGPAQTDTGDPIPGDPALAGGVDSASAGGAVPTPAEADHSASAAGEGTVPISAGVGDPVLAGGSAPGSVGTADLTPGQPGDPASAGGAAPVPGEGAVLTPAEVGDPALAGGVAQTSGEAAVPTPVVVDDPALAGGAALASGETPVPALLEVGDPASAGGPVAVSADAAFPTAAEAGDPVLAGGAALASGETPVLTLVEVGDPASAGGFAPVSGDAALLTPAEAGDPGLAGGAAPASGEAVAPAHAAPVAPEPVPAPVDGPQAAAPAAQPAPEGGAVEPPAASTPEAGAPSTPVDEEPGAVVLGGTPAVPVAVADTATPPAISVPQPGTEAGGGPTTPPAGTPITVPLGQTAADETPSAGTPVAAGPWDPAPGTPETAVPEAPTPDDVPGHVPVSATPAPEPALQEPQPLPPEQAAAEADVPRNPAAEPYEPAVRDAVHRVIRERRDIRNGFRSDPIPHDVLLRVLEAAHTAPSVGHSQPWDFVVIRSEKTREKMLELATRQREAYAKTLPKGRARQFRELKIEAILDTPVNIVVTADPTRGGRHTLGRHTQPQMAPYSSALAVENLWLAARAEGLGVGWVSFFDERQMVAELGLPEHLEVVAYLCVGYVDEFPDEAELVEAGWSQRRPLSWVVHEEEYGNRALPGEEPHDLLAETLSAIRPLDAKALGEAWERQKRMTKPAGALGMLEIISAQLSGLSRVCPPPIPEPAAVAIFAGDHGVHAQGVTAWPQEVTAQMVANFLGGGAVCNAFANQVGAEVCVIDVGVASELPSTPGLVPRKVRPGTADFTVGPAMTREEALRAIEVGIETARDLVAAGNKALLTGEMGIANTTTSAALIAVYTGADPTEVTGRGTGINDEMHARKVDVVRRALELHRPDPADPIAVLTAIGGLEHAAMAGLLLGAAALRTPVILDGVSAGAAALVARAIAPEVLAACIAGHRSAEPGHVAALTTLGLRPLIDLDLRLGEGTGALLALPLVQSAARVMHEVATFDAAGVTEKA